jgi:hypothetical protein
MMPPVTECAVSLKATGHSLGEVTPTPHQKIGLALFTLFRSQNTN